MAIANAKIEDALEMALTTLTCVSATGSNEEMIAERKMLIETVDMASNQKRRSMSADRVMPLIDSRPGCWLLDASREREIWHRLRNFSCLSRSEHQRVHQLAESARSSDVHRAYAAWHLQHTAK